MKIAGLVARILLGLLFTFFGANGFFHFLHMAPPTGGAAQYMAGLAAAHLFPVIFGIQLVCGLLLLSGFFVPLALVLIGPVIANILLFHLALEPAGIGPGLFAFLLWLIVFFSLREYFAGIFRARV
jgi:putative oxidoreductase